MFQASILRSQEAKKVGKVTGLEIPRFVSLKVKLLRRGPDSRIKLTGFWKGIIIFKSNC